MQLLAAEFMQWMAHTLTNHIKAHQCPPLLTMKDQLQQVLQSKGLYVTMWRDWDVFFLKNLKLAYAIANIEPFLIVLLTFLSMLCIDS